MLRTSTVPTLIHVAIDESQCSQDLGRTSLAKFRRLNNDGDLARAASAWIRAVQENYAPRLWALGRCVEPD